MADLLPDELLANIAVALPLDARCRCLRLCKRWRDLEDVQHVWAHCSFPHCTFRLLMRGNVDDSAFARVVRRAGLSLRTLECHSPWITDAALLEVALCSSLETVDISGCTRVSMEGILTLPASLKFLDVQCTDRDIELRPLRERFPKLEDIEHSLAWCDSPSCVDARVNASFDEQINEWYVQCRPCEGCECLHCEICVDFFKEDAYCSHCGEWRCYDCAVDWAEGQFMCEGPCCQWDGLLCANCKVLPEITQASPYLDAEDADRVFDMCEECFMCYENRNLKYD